MFDDLFPEPRTWKYAIPWMLVVLLISITGRMYASQNPEVQFWSMVPCGFTLLFFVIGAINAWKLVTKHMEEMFMEHQAALSRTPLVMLSENMRTMHPEAVRVLNRFGVRTSWQVRVGRNFGERDWVLADTNVHFGFIEYLLLNSSKSALRPKRFFSQGSKKWDPDGLVEDREQYDEFEKWLFARLMVTRSHGEFSPAEFIPPWTPELILETMGLSGEQDLYRPEEEPRKNLNDKQSAVSDQRSAGSGQLAVISEQSSVTSDQLPVASGQPGNGQKTPLSASQTSPQMGEHHLGGEELTEEELEAMRLEDERNASQYLQEGV